MRADSIVITRPCPVDLDALGVDRSGLAFHCPHCDKQVHVLSNRTQDEAQALLASLRGQGACVSYRRAKNGEVVFREPAPVVPAERLWARRRVASGLALALAACAPPSAPESLADAAPTERSSPAPLPPASSAQVTTPPSSPETATTAIVPAAKLETAAAVSPSASLDTTASPPTVAVAALPTNQPAGAEPGPVATAKAKRRPSPRKPGTPRKPASNFKHDIIDGGVF